MTFYVKGPGQDWGEPVGGEAVVTVRAETQPLAVPGCVYNAEAAETAMWEESFGPRDSAGAAHEIRRDAYAQRIYEYWNPGARWSRSHPDDRIAYRADADVAMAATDSLAGVDFAPAGRDDVYREVADRLAVYAGTTKDDAAAVARAADKVREWAQWASNFQPPGGDSFGEQGDTDTMQAQEAT